MECVLWTLVQLEWLASEREVAAEDKARTGLTDDVVAPAPPWMRSREAKEHCRAVKLGVNGRARQIGLLLHFVLSSEARCDG